MTDPKYQRGEGNTGEQCKACDAARAELLKQMQERSIFASLTRPSSIPDDLVYLPISFDEDGKPRKPIFDEVYMRYHTEPAWTVSEYYPDPEIERKAREFFDLHPELKGKSLKEMIRMLNDEAARLDMPSDQVPEPKQPPILIGSWLAWVLLALILLSYFIYLAGH